MAIATPYLRLGLIGVSGLLAALIVAEIVLLLPKTGAETDISPDAVTEQLANLMPRDIDSNVSTILSRSLFDAARASSEKTESEDDGNDAASQVTSRLSGIAIGPDGREALFQHDSEKPSSVKQGGKIEGWTVVTIETDHVVVVKTGGGEQTLHLADGPGAVARPRANIVRKTSAPKPKTPPRAPAAPRATGRQASR